MLKTTRSAETILAELYCFLSSAGFFQLAFAASAYHASKWPFTIFWSLPSTLFLTKPFSVLRAMILTDHNYTLLPYWEQELYLLNPGALDAIRKPVVVALLRAGDGWHGNHTRRSFCNTSRSILRRRCV